MTNIVFGLDETALLNLALERFNVDPGGFRLGSSNIAALTRTVKYAAVLISIDSQEETSMKVLTNPVGWFEIHVEDMGRAQTFYEKVLGRALVPLPSGDPSITMLMFAGDPESTGATGALVKHPMKHPSTEGVLVYFSCADCAHTSDLVLANGGRIFKPKFGIGPNGFIALIGDTEGNAIGLHSFS